jgi:hypothetical protein
MEREKSFSLLRKGPKKHKNVYLWYVAVEGAEMAVLLG